MSTMIERMKGAAMLRVDTYEEVEADTTATGQAAGVVIIAAMAHAIGVAGLGGGAVIGGLVTAFIGWIVWSGLTFLIGTKLLGGTATWGELLRTIGFAQTPRLFSILAFIPILGSIVQFGVAIWLLIAGIVAIRQALDFNTGKAVLTALLGWLAVMALGAIVGVAGFGGIALSR
jgi:hypothetical protein